MPKVLWHQFLKTGIIYEIYYIMRSPKMSEEIRIYNAVLHILDNNSNVFAPSNKELNVDIELAEFLSSHIEKAINDSNIKASAFEGASNEMESLCQSLLDNSDDFLDISTATAKRLFKIMTDNVDIAPADLICCLFEYENTPYYGIMKMNYKSGLTHFVQSEDDGNNNTLITYKTILPSESQKIEECAFVNLNNLSIGVIEKMYEIQGEKDFYFSKRFLQCTTDFSDNEKLKIIDKAARKINRKFYDEDLEKDAKLKDVITQCVVENNVIDVDTIVQEVYDNNIEVQNEYIAEIENAGLTEKTIPVDEKLVEKKYKKQKIKTDTGFEINFPPSFYNDKNKMEFINNPDGTISIVIKNVGKLS